MNPTLSPWLAPAWLLGVSLSLVWSGRRAKDAAPSLSLAVQIALLLTALVSPSGTIAFTALAGAGAMLAWTVRATSVTSGAYVAGSALLSGVAALTVGTSGGTTAFACSLLALAIRCGMLPLHAGVALLGERSSSRQLEQLAALPVLVFVHLRFVSGTAVALDVAPVVVSAGAASCLFFAVVSLAQRDLRRLYVASTLMHGGMLFAAVGAAAHGHVAAALLVAVTMALALAGYSTTLVALEARVGTGPLEDFAGRARAFPRLAASMAFFGGAAVGLPGTAGFVADDLLLHALWQDGAWATVAIIIASALLAVATLATFARVMFGAPRRHLAPDLGGDERRAVTILIVMLLVLGVFPALLVAPINALLR